MSIDPAVIPATAVQPCPSPYPQQRTVTENPKNSKRLRMGSDSENNKEHEQISKLRKDHDLFEEFLNMVSSDLKEKIEKQKLFKGNDKNTYSDIQLFMLTKYENRIERFRQVSRINLVNIISVVGDKENMDQGDITEHIKKHVEAIDKMKRRSKQILDISDKYAVEDIFDNINLVNECSTNLQPRSSTSSARASLGMRKWTSDSQMEARETPVEVMVRDQAAVAREVKALSAKSAGAGSSARLHSKRSALLSLTDHLAVLTKTYTGRR